MATIKEVAKLAGVSLGTVSNVLNGKTQNEELIQKVESAMKQLSYRPDATARSLKNTKTFTIGLVLPDAFQSQYKEFLMELEERFRENGYSLLTKFSRNNQLVEKKSVEALVELRVDGILIYSMVNQKKRNEWDDILTPMVLITDRSSVEFSGDVLMIDYRTAFQSMMADLKKRGYARPGMIMQENLLDGAGLRREYLRYYEDRSLIRVTDSNRERGFQAVFEMTLSEPGPDVLIAGSRDISVGINRAKSTLGIMDLPVYVLKEKNWMDDAGIYDGVLSFSQRQAADWAAKLLLERLQSSRVAQDGSEEQRLVRLTAQYFPMNKHPVRLEKAQHDLHFAMYDCSSARSLEMLTRIYERKTGKHVVFDKYPYDVLEKLLYQKSREKDSYYDGFMMDITWMEGLIESGFVRNLDHILEEKEYLAGFIEGAIKDYGMYVESLFALPFMSGAQILFYQKDLFEDRALQISYRRKYGEDLCPPKNWRQFNSVAEFFTKSYTSGSPVEYGVSMPRGENVYTTIDFLDRLWSFGGCVFDNEKKICIRSRNAEQALRSQMNSYNYSSGNELLSWNDISGEFAAGKSAMVILYNSDVGEINNYAKSKVTGNLGCAMIPGGIPVLGGWSLGLNRYGRYVEESEQFLRWACGSESSIPLSLLGGSTLRKEYYNGSDLETLEPWKHIVQESLRCSRKRGMPELLDDSSWKNTVYTQIIPRQIMRTLNKEISEAKAVENMESEILKFIFEH